MTVACVPVDNKGFTLLEILIAMVILSFGLLALGGMQVSGIKGNAGAMGLTEAAVIGTNKIEQLLALPYDDPELSDTDNDGTNQDGDDNGTDDDGDGFGLDDVPGGADHSETIGRYDVYWNVAVDEPMENTLRIRVFVQWLDFGNPRQVVFDIVKVSI
ncbi:MAG: prepilin-type N-terminal cleavage/methylation domain-containing protein [Desulfobacterium sp.]|nr:prepilin-type N-terminal cleavage/methylation domain-containing protein [Desulfobacterium sp.]